MWNELSTQEDIDGFMAMANGFHDSCLKELRYVSGAYADDKGMRPVNSVRAMSVVFQGLFEACTAIEMEFIGLSTLSMYNLNSIYSCEIHDATMLLEDGMVYWCDSGGLTTGDLDDYGGTWFSAERVRWRRVDGFMGDGEVFTYREGGLGGRAVQGDGA